MQNEIIIPDTSAWYYRAADYLLPVSLGAIVGILALFPVIF